MQKHLVDRVERVGSIRESEQLPVSCSARTPIPTCSTPPGKASSNYQTSRLISSSHGRHYCMAFGSELLPPHADANGSTLSSQRSTL